MARMRISHLGLPTAAKKAGIYDSEGGGLVLLQVTTDENGSIEIYHILYVFMVALDAS